MAVEKTIVTMIRTAIDDPDNGSPQFESEEIADIYETLNGESATIAYFFLAKASALTEPTAPTAPTVANLDTSVGYWDKKTQLDVSIFGQELALYREQMAHLRMLADIYRAQAQIFLEAAKGGEFS